MIGNSDNMVGHRQISTMILTTNYNTTSIIILFKTTNVFFLYANAMETSFSAIILDTKVRMVALSMIGIPKEKHRRANSKSHWPGF